MKSNITSKTFILLFLVLASLFVLFPIAMVLMNSFKGSLFISNAPFALPVFEGDNASYVALSNYFSGAKK